MMATILLLEDDPSFGKNMKLFLELEGYQVDWARDIRSVGPLVESRIPDCYLLDWNLPDGTGLELCEKIRETDEDVPIIFLTARIEEEYVVKALERGACDYMRKPVGQSELLLRLKKALKESHVVRDEIKFGDLCLERSQRRAFFARSELKLSGTEFDLLDALVKRAESVVSREKLVELIDEEGQISDRTLDSHISHLRARLKAAGAASIKIAAVYGVGYRLEKAAP
jgi:DNA-binding response OmpR family regulator